MLASKTREKLEKTSFGHDNIFFVQNLSWWIFIQHTISTILYWEKNVIEKKNLREFSSAAPSSRGIPMRHVWGWRERGGDVEHHRWLHVAGSWPWAPRTSKIADEPDLIYFNNNIESCIKITSIINETIFYIICKREGVAPAASHCCLWRCLLRAILANPCQSPRIGR